MANINTHLEIKNIKLSDVEPAPYNPRDISEEALSGLKESLLKFGLVELPVINKRNMRIISGHQRFKVLENAGIPEIQAIMVDMDEISEMALNVTLNSEEIRGYWTKALTPILEKLRNEANDDYLNLRLDALRKECFDLEIETKGKTLPDDLPEPPKDVITKLGDIWILGNHRLMCGDSTNEADVSKLMNGEKASLFATDPPYCVGYTGCDRPSESGEKAGKDWSDVYHEKDIKDAKGFMINFYTVGLKFIKENTALYLWHASKMIDVIHEICYELGILPHQQIIWVKPNPVLTFSYYMWRHEPCLFMWLKGHKPEYKPSLKSVGTVWKIDYLTSFDDDGLPLASNTDVWELGWNGKNRPPKLEHPTIKPTEVFAIPMRFHTEVGDICYEPFSGSGSQIIAGERLNRRVFAMELEPFFCDVAVKRWEDFTGKKARLETTNDGTKQQTKHW